MKQIEMTFFDSTLYWSKISRISTVQNIYVEEWLFKIHNETIVLFSFLFSFSWQKPTTSNDCSWINNKLYFHQCSLLFIHEYERTLHLRKSKTSSVLIIWLGFWNNDWNLYVQANLVYRRPHFRSINSSVFSLLQIVDSPFAKINS